MDPGRIFRSSLEIGPLEKHPDQDILGGVSGIVGVAHDLETDTPDTVAKTRSQLGEGRPVRPFSSSLGCELLIALTCLRQRFNHTGQPRPNSIRINEFELGVDSVLPVTRFESQEFEKKTAEGVAIRCCATSYQNPEFRIVNLRLERERRAVSVVSIVGLLGPV